MPTSKRLLCAGYAVLALAGIVLCWRENWHYVPMGAGAGLAAFFRDAWVTAASRSVSIDLLLIGASACVWMLVEAKRLRMRGAWLYVAFGVVVAISAALPLFLIGRELKLAEE